MYSKVDTTYTAFFRMALPGEYAEVAREVAEHSLETMVPIDRLEAFRRAFVWGLPSNEALVIQALHCWSVAFKDAQGVKDQQVIEQAKLNTLIEMFFMVHAQYKAYFYQGMTKALIAVFREILALWHPWMWGSSRKAFEFCAAAVAGMSTGGEYAGWTDAMRLMQGRHIRKDERDIMTTLIQERVNNEKSCMDSFNEDTLEKWIDAYAFSTHFPEKVMTALATACARKGGTCRARTGAMYREICGNLAWIHATRPLKSALKKVVRQWADFGHRMQNAFSSHMWGKCESMAKDEPKKSNSFYGKIIIRYLSLTAVQVDVILPGDISAALQMDMGRRADEHADYFRLVMGDGVAVMIRVSLHDMAIQCVVRRGKEFDALPLGADDLINEE